MEALFEKEFAALRVKVLEMAAYTDRAVERALQALLNRDPELAQQVIDNDHEINRLECELDEASIKLLALAQPMARDLRGVVGSMRLVMNLERIGDEAANIAERVLILSNRPPLPFNDSLKQLGDQTLSMFRTAVTAFKNDDPDMGRMVCQMDYEADELDMTIVKNLMDYMQNDTPAMTRAVHTIFVSRSLERIADLSTNLGEAVIFITEGIDIKHYCDRNSV